jgi:ubiquinone/menaquinone biosynthesis C-methylase UbiE
MDETLRKRIKKANVEYHSKMAKVYDETQPYFTKENTERVRGELEAIAAKAGDKKFLDIGTGTGFLLNIAKDIFDEVIGIDITEEMLKRVPKARNITVMVADSENMPFENETFNACGAYSVLHHLPTLEPTLKEAHRVLKRGGYLFADQDHNADYLSTLTAPTEDIVWGELALKAYKLKTQTADDVHAKYGVAKEVVETAEFQAVTKGGFTSGQLREELERAGFKGVIITPRWYLNQAELEHDSKAAARKVEKYLLDTMPLSAPFFKYLVTIGRKG